VIKNSYGHLRHIVQSARRERALASVVYVLGEIVNLVRGRLSAMTVGWKYSHLGSGSKVLGSKYIFIGKHASIKRQAWIEAISSYQTQTFSPTIKIGQKFFASESLHISAINKIEIGDNCLFGSGVYISDHNHGVYKGDVQSSPLEPPILRKLVSFGSVTIGSNVWLGDNVIIVGPVNIGNGVIVGANSVITKDIPEHTMVAGSPIKILKYFNDERKRWEKHGSS